MEIAYMVIGAALFGAGLFCGLKQRANHNTVTRSKEEREETISADMQRQLENWYSYDGRRQE